MTDPGLAAGRSPDIVLEGRFVAADRMRYVLVPFEVPPDLRQLEIGYTYSDRIDSDPLVGGGNTLYMIGGGRGVSTRGGSCFSISGARSW